MQVNKVVPLKMGVEKPVERWVSSEWVDFYERAIEFDLAARRFAEASRSLGLTETENQAEAVSEFAWDCALRARVEGRTCGEV